MSQTPPSYAIYDVLGDGNCFYRALYNAALRSGLLKRVIKKLHTSSACARNLPQKNGFAETSFVHFARQCIACYVMQDTKQTSITRSVYNNLVQLKKTDKPTYREVLSGFPSWFRHLFSTRLPQCYERFQSRYAAKVAQFGNWVSEIEVRVCMHILRSIPFEIKNDTKLANLQDGTIYLVNVGEYHYKYIAKRNSIPSIGG